MIPIPPRFTVQVLPGLKARYQGREGALVAYEPDGNGGVRIRLDWRHAAEFWLELHLDTGPRCAPSQEEMAAAAAASAPAQKGLVPHGD